jgi:trimeric autotransporter adhesin
MKRLSVGAFLCLIAILGFAQPNQTITFPALTNRTYGAADFAPGATASSGLTVTYTSGNTAIATIVANQIHIVAVGTVSITANQAGNGTWNPASPVSQNLTIDKKTITIGGSFTISNKVYNTTTAAAIATNSLSLVGIVGSDVVTLTPVTTFADKTAANGKTVSLTGSSIAGAASGNYTLSLTGAPTATANITQANLTVTGSTASNKVYNATTAATLGGTPAVTPQAGDAVTPGGAAAGTFADKNVGAGKSVTVTGVTISGTDAANYNLIQQTGLTANITQAAVTVTAQTDTKVYTANISSAVAPVVTGIIAPDVVGTAPTQTFNSKTVAVGKTLTASGLGINDGNGGLNYSVSYVTNATGVINKANLTVTGSTALNKVYDRFATAPLGGAPTVTPIAGDVVTAGGAAAGTFADKVVGVGKTVTITGVTISGADAANYNLIQQTGLTANITQLNLPVTGLTASNKVYDTFTTATLSGSATITPIAGDVVVLSGTPAGVFADKNAANGKTVTVTGLSISGTDAANYIQVSPVGLTANITKAPVTVTAQTDTKVYTATTNSSVSPLVSGIIAPDAVSTAPLQTFNNKNVAVGKTLTPSGLVINDGNSGLNYTISNITNITGVITKANLIVSGNTALNKVYDRLLTAPLGGAPTVTPLLSDVVTVGGAAAGTFADKIVGVGKTVTITGVTIAGADAANYNLIQQSGLTANITQANLTITGLTANNKVYDTFTTATLAGTATVTPIAGDVVTASGVPIGNFIDKNVGNGKSVLITGLTLSGADAGNYNPVISGLTANITKAGPVTVTATGPTKIYGTTLTTGPSATNFTRSGEIGGELVTSVTLTPNAAGTSPTTAAGLAYTVTPSLATGSGGFLEGNYNVTYILYNGVVAKAPLSITANNINKTYGVTLFSGSGGPTTFTPVGLQNAETIGSVTLTYGIASSPTTSVGTWTNQITTSAATGGTFSASNYTITYIQGNIIIVPAALTITANKINKLSGATLTSYSGSTAYSRVGLQNSETIGSVTITYGTGAATGDAAGVYANQVTPSTAIGGTFTASNYSITYTKSTIYVYSKVLPYLKAPRDTTSCEGYSVFFEPALNTYVSNPKYLWQYRESSTFPWKNLVNPPVKHHGDSTRTFWVDNITKTLTGYQFSCKIVTRFYEDSLAVVKIVRGDSIMPSAVTPPPATASAVSTLSIVDPPPLSVISRKGSNILICTNADSVTYKWGDAVSLITGQTKQYFVVPNVNNINNYYVITTGIKSGCFTKVNYGQTGTVSPVRWDPPTFTTTVTPNPSNGTFTVSVPGVLANTAIQVYVRDFYGNTKYANTKKQTTSTVLNMLSSEFPALKTGIYFIDITQGTKRAVKKIIVNAN